MSKIAQFFDGIIKKFVPEFFIEDGAALIAEHPGRNTYAYRDQSGHLHTVVCNPNVRCEGGSLVISRRMVQ